MSVIAKASARMILNYYDIRLPSEIDIESIAGGQGAFVDEKEMVGAEGRIVHKKDKGIIVVNSNITYEPQKRFVIAHELGHFKLHKDIKLFNCTPETFLEWQTEFSRESEANIFAAELLMPERIFNSISEGRMISIDLISELAEIFKTSFTSTLFRYAEIGNHPIAIVYCKDEIVKWSKINDSFNYKFIRTGRNISPDSYTHNFFNGEIIPNTPEEIPLDAWFSESFDYESSKFVFEQLKTFPQYNSVLAVIWEN